ncbi:MAG: hypothetical protein ACREEM_06955 [Blastocatellia bacterium]
MSQQDNNQSQEIKTRMRLSRPIPSLYPHQLALQISQDEVILSFFEVFLPYLNDPTPEERERVLEVGIPAECIARLSVSKRRFHEFAQLMMETSERLKAEEQKSPS